MRCRFGVKQKGFAGRSRFKILWMYIEEYPLSLLSKHAIWLFFVLASIVLTRAQTTEQIETGQIHLPNGTDAPYRIRLLPLASFPELPAAVSAHLAQLHCLIPQTYQAKRPENIIHGAFQQKGSDDWAVLCSHDGLTTLYVIFGNQPESSIALRSQKDNEWIGKPYPGYPVNGFAWGIDLRRSKEIRHKTKGQRVEADHDGIEDAFLEKSSTMHYYQDGNWVTLDTEN